MANQGKYASKGYRTVVLLLLTLIYAFNFIDRQIIGILSPFIQAELGFTDAQLGWLKGFAFALLYTTVGIPIAWLADRYSRVKIVSVSLAVWSGFTALTGMAGGFTSMLMARIGVGIGEAGGSPPSHSIISDLYPKEKRASALGIYSLGIPVGIAFSYIAAGILLEAIGWRNTLKLLGVIGVGLAIIVFLVIKEPRRGQMESTQVSAKPVGLMESFSTLFRIPSWWAMCMGIAWVSFGSYAVSNWSIDYIFRAFPEYRPSPDNNNFSNLMYALGLIHLFGYGAGTYFGAVITEKLAKKSVSAYGWVPAVAILMAIPCITMAFWVESVPAMLGLLSLTLVFTGVYLGPSFASAQTLAPINMRAMSTALFFLFLNIIALGGGPTFVGILSTSLTEVHGETQALRISMTWLIIPYTISVIAFFWAAKTMPKDWEAAEARNEGAAKADA